MLMLMRSDLPSRLHVVHKDGTEFQVGTVEFARQRWIVGTGECAPGRAVERGVTGTAFQDHASLHQPSVGKHFKANRHRSRFQDGWIYFVRNQWIPGPFGLPVPAHEPRIEVHTLRV